MIEYPSKTQLALEIAYQARDIKSLLWIQASSAEHLDKSFRDALDRLDIKPSPDIDPFKVVEDWLRKPQNGPWLMIVDNVDDLDVIFSRSTQESPSKDKLQLLSCIPHVPHGSVLFTTRWKHVANNITTRDHICLSEMNEEQGVCLIKSRLGEAYEHSTDTKAFLEELGYIPLAIMHAAAFMSENGVGVSEYLETYRKSEADKSSMLQPAMNSMGVRDSNEAYSTDEHPVLKPGSFLSTTSKPPESLTRWPPTCFL